VGVDVGKDWHHVSIRDLSQDKNGKAFSFTNDHDGFMELIATLDELSSDKSDFLIGVEACSYALNLSYFLMAMGFDLVEVNLFRAGQFRKAQGKKAKTDKIDARTIAAILALGDHKPLSIQNPILDNLRELSRFRVDLINEKATTVIHLREAFECTLP
jgi:transposase